MNARNSKEVLRRSRDSVISWSDLQRCNTKHTPLRKITSCINFHSRFFYHCKILKSMKLKNKELKENKKRQGLNKQSQNSSLCLLNYPLFVSISFNVLFGFLVMFVFCCSSVFESAFAAKQPSFSLV